MNLFGKRVAIAGMAKSGIAVGKAVKQLGGEATVFDQKPADDPSIIEAIDELHSAEVCAAPGWHGRLDPEEFDMLVLSPGFPVDHPAVRDMKSREVIGEIEFGFRIAHDPIIAITGTNGKSTTTVLTWRLLEAAGKSALLCGNIAGSGYAEMTLTEAALEGADVLVAEISSFQLETVDEFRPFVAAITNISPDHLNRHKNFENYRNCKLKLFANMRDADVIVMNSDERSITKEMFHEDARRVRFSPTGYGPTSGSTARANDILFLSGHQVRAEKLPLLGEHNIANLMMAWELACAILGEPSTEQIDAMLSAMLSFKGLANRMERVAERDGVLVINNSMCTNPAAVIASSRGFDKRQHLLLGGHRKSLDFAPVGEFLKETRHSAYLFGPDTVGLNEQMGSDWPSYSSMEDAFIAATENAIENEAIILMPGCLSAEPFANFRERGDAFRELAKRWAGA